MEKLTAQKKISIVRQYLSGLSYDEIAAKTRVSKGSVANVVTDMKIGELPEAADIVEQIELLRELSIDLKASALTPGQCAIGLTVFKRIKECGLDPADIERWPLILKSAGNADQLPDFIRLVYDIQGVIKKTGMSLEELRDDVQEQEKKAAELEPIAKQCEDTKKQVAALTQQRNKLTDLIGSLEQKYKFLNPRVNDIEKREQSLLQRASSLEERAEKAETTLVALSREKQKLDETGFSISGLIEFNQRVKSIAQRHQIKPVDLGHRLLRELEELNAGLGLETLVEKQQIELNNQTQSLETAKRKLEILKTAINNLEQEKAGLETSIKNIRGKVCIELAKIAPAASGAVNRLVEELHHGYDEALAQIQQLREETLEAGKEIGRLQGIIQTNEWLSDLLVMVKGEEGIEGKRIRVIILLVLRGAVVWMQRNMTNQTKISALLFHIDNLIKELEEWKT